MKRFFALFLGLVTAFSCLFPAFAYEDPHTEAMSSDWSTKAVVNMDGSIVGYQNYGGAAVTSLKSRTAAPSDALTLEPGALHLIGQGENTFLHTTAVTTESFSEIIDVERGMTFDLCARLDNLPKITDHAYMTDTGAAIANLQGGFIFNIASSKRFWADSNKYNNELFCTFVKYDNETLGTNAALSIIQGNRNAMATAGQATPYTFFFHLPEEYARYTIKFDTQNATTSFYIDGVAQTCAQTGTTVVPTVALMYRTTATSNFININCACVQETVTASNAECYADVYIDQFDLYPYAITPSGDTAAQFIESVPLETDAFEAWIGVLKDLHEAYYTPASWASAQSALAAAEAFDTTGATQTEVNALTASMRAAFNALEMVGLDRLYIASTASSSNIETAWTCGSILFTESGYNLSDYIVNGMNLGSWCRITGVYLGKGIYRITKIIPGVFQTGSSTAVGENEIVPENGFIFAFHRNNEGNTTTPWNPVAGGSQYASQEFGDRNGKAYAAMGLSVNSLVRFENVAIDYTGDSVLSTTGVWEHRYVPGVVPSAIYRPSAVVNSGASGGEGGYLARDRFEDFETSSYLVPVDSYPNLTVQIEGEGSVFVNDEALGAQSRDYAVPAGGIVNLEARGERFLYWKNARTNAVFATAPAINFRFGVSEMNLVAVFAEEESQSASEYPVYFRDSKTGKILSTVQVASGETVPAALIPDLAPISGYSFEGWFAEGNSANPIESCVITGSMTFVSRYRADENTLYTLTVRESGGTRTYQRRYAAIAGVSAEGTGFSYWTLDGSYYSSQRRIQFSMPNHDCVLEAVSQSGLAFSPSVSLVSCFVDSSGTLTATFSRDLPEGNTLLESGVLLTRKATPDDLTVDTPVSSVTRGVSRAQAEKNSYGFVKPNMFSKTGTWYIRGYLSYADINGDLQTAYTAIYTVEVASSGAAESEVYWMEATFEPGGGFDPYTPSTIIYQASELGPDAYRPFFPSVTQADNGTLLCTFYYSDGHARYNQTQGKLVGVTKLVKSYDNGDTWTDPITLIDLTDEDKENGNFNCESRDPNLQKLSDGTIILTTPVRGPIGKPGYNNNSNSYGDYWTTRTYYMTSTDNGETWSELKEVECDYFSHGEPFLYDDPTRTTGNWAKNGTIAELPNGDLLFPLFGAETCDSRGIWQTVVVKAHNNGDGTLTFCKDWTTDENGDPCDAARIVPTLGTNDEVALIAYGNTVYALVRTIMPSVTAGGPVYRSLDGGATWEFYALEPTANDALNQPWFCKLTDKLVLANYSVPLASVANSPAKRTARPVYGKLFNLETGDWMEYDPVLIYDLKTATVADVANPVSVLLDDGRIFTVFYDNSAPATKYGFIGGTYTTIANYDGSVSPGSQYGMAGPVVEEYDFEDLSLNGVYAASGTSATAINGVLSVGKINRTRDTDNGGTYGHAELRVSGSGSDKYLEFYTNNQKRSACPTNKILLSGDKGGDCIVSFDYNFGNNITVDGEYHKIELRPFDTSNALSRNTTTLGVKITPGAITVLNGGTALETISLSASANTWYTVKVIYQGGQAAFKAFARGASEPAWSQTYEVNSETLAAVQAGSPIGIACWARGTSQSAVQENSIYIDNVTVGETVFAVTGVERAYGVNLRVGRSTAIRVLIESTLPISCGSTLKAYSDHPSVARVNADGTVTGLAPGVARITIKDGTNIYTVPVKVFKYASSTPYAGKKVAVIGDSITMGAGTTAGNEWWQIMADQLDLGEIVADGLSAGCISKTAYFAPGTEKPAFTERTDALPDDADYYFVFGGTNDWAHGSVLGTISDTSDTSFYGAIDELVQLLQAKNPSAGIVFITPLRRYGNSFRKNGTRMPYDTDLNDDGHSLGDYRNAIIEKAFSLGIPVIDAYSFTWFDPAANQTGTGGFDATRPGACPYTEDGLHPNTEGHAALGRVIAGYLQTQ